MCERFYAYANKVITNGDSKFSGQCQVPLSELETKCEVHKSLVLMDGRRPLPEAKMEVRVTKIYSFIVFSREF